MMRIIIALLIVCHSATAQIEQHRIGALTIEVYLPPSYDPTEEYPVVYANDGEWLFGTNSWGLDKNLNQWITSKKIEPVIFVGIFNDGNRESKYIPFEDPTIRGYSSEAEEYTRQLVGDVIPFVDSVYATSQKRAILGSSFGGLHSTWAGMNNPEIFDFIIAQSPSYWVADFKIHDLAVKSANQKIWIDIGTKDWDDVLTMYYTLCKKGFTPQENLFYFEDVDGTHSGNSWSNRLIYPLILFTKDPNDKVSSFDLVVEYIPSAQRRGHYFSRINPVVTLQNGVKFTAFPISLNTKEGNIEVSPYGSFKLKEKTSDEVSGMYSDKKASLKIKWKDNPMNNPARR